MSIDSDVTSLKGRLQSLSLQEFWASDPEVGEGVAGMRIARDSEHGILAVYRSADTFNFDDGSGIAALLVETDGDVILRDAGLIVTGASGYVALGNPAPTSSTAGTGIWIDRTGLYGLNSNTRQFYVRATDGKAVAGAGVVLLDSDGITLQDDYTSPNTLKWKDAGTLKADLGFDALTHTGIWGVYNQLDDAVNARMTVETTDTSLGDMTGVFDLRVDAASGNTNYAALYGSNFQGLVIYDDSAIPGGPGNDDLVIRGETPRLLFDDTTGAAKSLRVTVEANVAAFSEKAGTDILVLDLANTRVGIGFASPSFPLSFGTGLGNKIGLYDVGGGSGYGFGIQANLLQIFANTSGDRVGIGYGNSGSFTETLTVKSSGVGIGANNPGATTLTLGDGINLVVGSTNGTKIGTATTQKIGFYNATPIVRPSAYTQTYSTADKTHAARTASALTDSTGGTADTTLQSIGAVYSQTEVRNNFADVAAQINNLRTDLLDTASLVNALLDDLQGLGLVG